MRREDFIKFIPKPENKDIILYDISLQDLLNVNVLEEYNKLFPIFIIKKEEYITYKEKLAEYQKSINNIYLFKPSWTQEDYLQSLQNDKRTYSTLYGEIKKIENNISMLKKNLKGIDEKIQIQIAKENKKIESKKEELDKNIEKEKEKLLNLRNFLEAYKSSLENIETKIKDNEEEFEMFSKMQQKLNEGECKCELCGRIIKSVDENSNIYKRLYNNIIKNKNSLEKLLKSKEKLELNISYYEEEIRKVKSDLNNDIQFKKENGNLYQKKNLEILKLEAIRDETLNNINKLEKQLASNSITKTQHYQNLKSNIEKYELSLANLTKIKETKENLAKEIEKFNELKKEFKEIFEKIKLYLKFIEIYFKILQQKANEYTGDKFKFKFFKVEDYKLIPILEIYYDGVEYTQLDKKVKAEVDKTLVEKFSIYF